MFDFVNQKIMNFDFKCDRSYYRLFNYLINKRHEIHIFFSDIIYKKIILKVDMYFYY